MTIDQFNNLAPFGSASWAIWSEQFDQAGCLEQNRIAIQPFLANQIMHLNENVLLVGSGRVVGALNQLQAPFDNFHGLRIDYPRCHDYRLKQFIQGNQLNSILGGFMTDIPENDAGAYATFLEQLAILDADHFQMISFGDIPFHTLEANLLPAQINDLPHGIRAFQSALILNNRNCFIDIYRVWHYALWGRYQHYIVQLEEQLQYINDLLA